MKAGLPISKFWLFHFCWSASVAVKCQSRNVLAVKLLYFNSFITYPWKEKDLNGIHGDIFNAKLAKVSLMWVLFIFEVYLEESDELAENEENSSI